ncbi:MAG TPA: AtpZ/AtpI family protein [Chryseolinea sp.]|nr:AtpZ/AtpI family protein [Chryseolinea sp.]HPM31705.1 AtpZ/AtpI family protein [Chryseolinea sp.]
MALVDPSPSKKPKPSSYYLKYSSLAIQLLAAMFFMGWLGYLLDKYLALKFPAFMLFFGFSAFAGMMYQIYRSINKDNQ